MRERKKCFLCKEQQKKGNVFVLNIILPQYWCETKNILQNSWDTKTFRFSYEILGYNTIVRVFSDRLKLYCFMLEHMTDEQRFQITAKICTEVSYLFLQQLP